MSDTMADLIPPQPEEDVNYYTQNRHQQGLQYSEARLTRKISPVTHAFMKKYHDAYEHALESTTERNIGAVFAYDELLHSKAFLQREFSNSEMELVHELQRLRELEFLASYGDYLGANTSELRHRSRELKTPYYEQLSARSNWTTIAERLTVQIQANSSAEVGVKAAVYAACMKIPLDYDQTMWAIQAYAERNGHCHNDVGEFIENMQWTKLAKRINADLHDMPSAIPLTRLAELPSWIKAIETVRDRYLAVNKDDDPETWVPANRALELTEESIKKKERQHAKE